MRVNNNIHNFSNQWYQPICGGTGLGYVLSNDLTTL